MATAANQNKYMEDCMIEIYFFNTVYNCTNCVSRSACNKPKQTI